MTDFDKRSGLAFIIAFGIVSLWADMAYEGMRSISGPFLGTLGASGAIVGAVAGVGELFGYLLRLGSGRLAERTGAYWPIALAGYTIQMAAVPALALAGTWWAAAIFIVIERSGKALRNPAANTMMSRAGEHIGQGWAFGLHEALDQTGALSGPLIAALVLALHHDYRLAFLWLGVPALFTILSVVTVRARFPYAGHIARAPSHTTGTGLSRAFWLYAASAALVAFGFADYSLIAFHYAQAHVVSQAIVPIFYAAAMGDIGRGFASLRTLVRQKRFARAGAGIAARRCRGSARLSRRHMARAHRHACLGTFARRPRRDHECGRGADGARTRARAEPMESSPRSTASPGLSAAHLRACSTMFRLWGLSCLRALQNSLRSFP